MSPANLSAIYTRWTRIKRHVDVANQNCRVSRNYPHRGVLLKDVKKPFLVGQETLREVFSERERERGRGKLRVENCSRENGQTIFTAKHLDVLHGPLRAEVSWCDFLMPSGLHTHIHIHMHTHIYIYI